MDDKKVYAKPAITHELTLETRAGSCPHIPDPNDPLGIDTVCPH